MASFDLQTDDPSMWYGPEFERNDDWIFVLESRHIAELRAVVDSLVSGGESLVGLEQSACEMPELSPELRRIQQDVVAGKGFALIRGVPVEGWTIEQSATAFWAIGLHFGWPISQNGKGHLLGHVCDIKADLTNPKSRKYATNAAQPYHTDSCDIVGLLCLRTAREGGLSSMSSSATIYEEMRSSRPDLASVLSAPLPVDRKGETPDGKAQFYMMPVFNDLDGRISTIYARDFIESSQRHADAPRLTEQQVEALDLFDQMAASARFRVDMELQKGDVQFVHNHQIVHSRSAYRDHAEVARRRHLLRLWLAPANGRPLPSAFRERYGSITQGTRRGGIHVPGIEEQVVLVPE